MSSINHNPNNVEIDTFVNLDDKVEVYLISLTPSQVFATVAPKNDIQLASSWQVMTRRLKPITNETNKNRRWGMSENNGGKELIGKSVFYEVHFTDCLPKTFEVKAGEDINQIIKQYIESQNRGVPKSERIYLERKKRINN